MRIRAFIYALVFMPIYVVSQNLDYNFPLIKEGYIGKIKSIRTYSIGFDQIDSSNVYDTAMLDTLTQSLNIFNQVGHLMKSEYLGNKGKIETYYEYNDDESLKSIKKIRQDSIIVENDYFTYDKINNTVIQILCLPQKESSGNKVVKKIYRFDKDNNNTQINHIDSLDTVIHTTRLYYDKKGNLVKGENYKFMTLVDSFTQVFNLSGQKENVKVYSRNGELFTQTFFDMTNDGNKQMKLFDSENNLLEWHESVSKKDKLGNVIKEYIYDLIGNYTIVYTHEIEYYP